MPLAQVWRASFDDPNSLNPSTMHSKDIMRLQRMMGNQAVANLIARAKHLATRSALRVAP